MVKLETWGRKTTWPKPFFDSGSCNEPLVWLAQLQNASCRSHAEKSMEPVIWSKLLLKATNSQSFRRHSENHSETHHCNGIYHVCCICCIQYASICSISTSAISTSSTGSPQFREIITIFPEYYHLVTSNESSLPHLATNAGGHWEMSLHCGQLRGWSLKAFVEEMRRHWHKITGRGNFLRKLLVLSERWNNSCFTAPLFIAHFAAGSAFFCSI